MCGSRCGNAGAHRLHRPHRRREAGCRALHAPFPRASDATAETISGAEAPCIVKPNGDYEGSVRLAPIADESQTGESQTEQRQLAGSETASTSTACVDTFWLIVRLYGWLASSANVVNAWNDPVQFWTAPDGWLNVRACVRNQVAPFLRHVQARLRSGRNVAIGNPFEQRGASNSIVEHDRPPEPGAGRRAGEASRRGPGAQAGRCIEFDIGVANGVLQHERETRGEQDVGPRTSRVSTASGRLADRACMHADVEPGSGMERLPATSCLARRWRRAAPGWA